MPEPDDNTVDTQEEPGRAPTTVELAGLLKMASHLFTRYGTRMFSEFSEQKLSFPRIKVLTLVAENSLRVGDYPRMNDIARELGVTPRNITTIVDGLEREGLLMRRPDRDDRRAIQLELTPQGRAQIEELDQLQNQMCDFFFAPLDYEQRQQLFTILNTLSTERHLPDEDEVECPADQPLAGVRKHLKQFHEQHGRNRRKTHLI